MNTKKIIRGITLILFIFLVGIITPSYAMDTTAPVASMNTQLIYRATEPLGVQTVGITAFDPESGISIVAWSVDYTPTGGTSRRIADYDSTGSTQSYDLQLQGCGVYNVSCSVTNGAGITTDIWKTETTRVIVDTTAPIASMNTQLIYRGIEPTGIQTVWITASDPESGVATVMWSVDYTPIGGTASRIVNYQSTGSIQSYDLQLQGCGLYNVACTVINGAGITTDIWRTETTRVIVDTAAPIASMNTQLIYRGTEPTGIQTVGITASDPESGVATVMWSVDYTPIGGTASRIVNYQSTGSIQSYDLQLQGCGLYNVACTVINGAGITTDIWRTETTIIIVDTSAPTIGSITETQSVTLQSGENISVIASGLADDCAGLAGVELSYMIPGTSEYVTNYTGNTSSSISLSVPVGPEGNYAIRVRAKDRAENYSDYKTTTINVVYNSDLGITLTWSTVGELSKSIEIKNNSMVRVNWGDGNITNVPASLVTTNVSHTYPTEGTYTVNIYGNAVTTFNAISKKITAFNARTSPLVALNISGNLIENIDISGATTLQSINISKTDLTTINSPYALDLSNYSTLNMVVYTKRSTNILNLGNVGNRRIEIINAADAGGEI